MRQMAYFIWNWNELYVYCLKTSCKALFKLKLFMINLCLFALLHDIIAQLTQNAYQRHCVNNLVMLSYACEYCSSFECFMLLMKDFCLIHKVLDSSYHSQVVKLNIFYHYACCCLRHQLRKSNE